MADYTSEKQSALADITAAGGAISIATTTGGTYNGVTETYTGSSTTTQSTYALVKDFDMKFIDGERIQIGDLMFIIPALLASGSSLSIDQNSTITMGGITYKIVNLRKVGPSGDAILYKAHARK